MEHVRPAADSGICMLRENAKATQVTSVATLPQNLQSGRVKKTERTERQAAGAKAKEG